MKIQSEKGASAVEFALILPLLVLLVFGIIEFSVMLFDKAVITNASREGARHGIVFNQDSDGVYSPISDADIRDRVKTYANGRLINLGGSDQSLSDADIVIAGDRVSDTDLTVTVNFTYDFMIVPNLSALVGGTFDGTTDLIGQTIMRME